MRHAEILLGLHGELLGHEDKVVLLRVLYRLLYNMLIQVMGLSAPGIPENKL